MSSAVTSMVVSGNTVYAGGYFTTVGDSARNHIAAIDKTSGIATDWKANADEPVFALAKSGATIYAGGDFSASMILHEIKLRQLILRPEMQQHGILQ